MFRFLHTGAAVAVLAIAAFLPSPARAGHSFTISASDTDPYVNTVEPPAGATFRMLHLWLTAAEPVENPGVSALGALLVSDGIEILDFAPAFLVLELEPPIQVAMATCDSLPPRRLGTILVIDSGGSLWCEPLPGYEHIIVADCDQFETPGWVYGFSSDGSVPRMVTNGALPWRPDFSNPAHGGGGLDGGVLCLLADGSAPADSLFVGGEFTRTGAASAGSIACLRPGETETAAARWSNLDGGVSGPVHALTRAPDGSVVAGGSFTAAGSAALPVQNIAAWDGTAWSDPAPGLDDTVRALRTASIAGGPATVFAGGSFTRRPGDGAATLRGAALRSGGDWHRLPDLDGTPGVSGPGGADGAVYAMLDHGGDLIVGGAFTTAGSTAAAGVARWTVSGGDSSWAALGSGLLGGDVLAFTSLEGDLVAGGSFTHTLHGATPATLNGVARWNEAAGEWEPFEPLLDSGSVVGAVHAPAAAPGMLIIGGDLTGFDGSVTPANDLLLRVPAQTDFWATMSGGFFPPGLGTPLTSYPDVRAIVEFHDEIAMGSRHRAVGNPSYESYALSIFSASPDVVGAPEVASAPPSGTLRFGPPRPHPAHGRGLVRIDFVSQLARPTLSARVVNTAGRLVATPSIVWHSDHRGDVVWDRRTSSGAPVASGVYFVQLEDAATRSSTTAKVVVTR